jgi:transcriptional regulator with XRE-family HTH domain
MSPKRLSRMLKTRREAKGLTQVELAKRARVTQTYIAKLESGDKQNPSLGTLQRLAKALGVPVTELLG